MPFDLCFLPFGPHVVIPVEMQEAATLLKDGMIDLFTCVTCCLISVVPSFWGFATHGVTAGGNSCSGAAARPGRTGGPPLFSESRARAFVQKTQGRRQVFVWQMLGSCKMFLILLQFALAESLERLEAVSSVCDLWGSGPPLWLPGELSRSDGARRQVPDLMFLLHPVNPSFQCWR